MGKEGRLGQSRWVDSSHGYYHLSEGIEWSLLAASAFQLVELQPFAQQGADFLLPSPHQNMKQILVKFQLIELSSLLPFLDFLVYKLEAQEALNKEKVGMVYSSECVCSNGKDFSSTTTVMRPVLLSGRHERL